MVEMDLYGSRSGQQQVEWERESGVEETVPQWNVWERDVYPERPDVPNCAYFMRTGSCGYGAKCRYNHPRNRTISLEGAEYPERIGEPVCQYYLRTGKCKFSAFCKYNHPKNAGGSLTNAPLNTYGYPLRPGEKECSYYLKMGQCKFGVACKFHHPHPAGSTMPASARPFYPTVQFLSSPSPERYESTTTSYRVARPPMMPGSYVPGAYGPFLLHPGMVSVSNWNLYSGPVSHEPSPSAERSVGPASIYGMPQIRSSVPTLTVQPSVGAASTYGTSHIGSSAPVPAIGGAYSQVLASNSPSGNTATENRFPERPGKPDCKYYMRTGECKYGPACRYTHPPNRAISMSGAALSPFGLPLRPGVQACSFYMQTGRCKFGSTCKFDHPMANPNYIPVASYAEMPG